MKYILTIIIAFTLTACATSYQSQGIDGGYSDTQIDENVFKVSFKGNASTSKERAADFTLLRSAEITIENGYKYFIIMNEDNYSESMSVTTPTISHTNANITGNHVTATTNTSGGQTHNYSMPTSSNTIMCFKSKPLDAFSYNAEFIYKNLIKKYDIEVQ